MRSILAFATLAVLFFRSYADDCSINALPQELRDQYGVSDWGVEAWSVGPNLPDSPCSGDLLGAVYGTKGHCSIKWHSTWHS